MNTGLSLALYAAGQSSAAQKNDQEEIVQQVISALGTPVFGTVDSENNIILTGALAAGTYTLKYESAQESTTVIGTITLGDSSDPAEPSYTNILDEYEVTLNKRWSGSSGQAVEDVGMIYFMVPWNAIINRTMRFKGFPGDIAAFGSKNTSSTVWTDANNTKLDVSYRRNAAGELVYKSDIWNSDGVTDENGVYSYVFDTTHINGFGNADAVNVYFNFVLSSTRSVTASDLENLIITIDEPIE